MARKGRIEFPGAVYHVLDRGDRREPIVRSDKDRAAFVRTLEQACERAGWRVHAFVLMSNHYHLLIETPEANLVAGMRWFQTTWNIDSASDDGAERMDRPVAPPWTCQPSQPLLVENECGDCRIGEAL